MYNISSHQIQSKSTEFYINSLIFPSSLILKNPILIILFASKYFLHMHLHIYTSFKITIPILLITVTLPNEICHFLVLLYVLMYPARDVHVKYHILKLLKIFFSDGYATNIIIARFKCFNFFLSLRTYFIFIILKHVHGYKTKSTKQIYILKDLASILSPSSPSIATYIAMLHSLNIRNLKRYCSLLTVSKSL